MAAPLENSAPPWFLKAVRKELMWMDTGHDIDPIAERIWRDIQKDWAFVPSNATQK